MGLKSDLMGDLITDYRCAIRDNHLTYANKCLDEIKIIFKNRHKLKYNRYGYPTCIQ